MSDRTSNSAKNIFSSVGLKLILTILQFASKTFFVRYLADFLGVSSLISSILSYLNITELGIGTAIVFAMYKPIADNDEEKIKQYVQYYKKVNFVLGFISLGLAVILAPFLPLLMDFSEISLSVFEIYIIYVLYAFSSVYYYFVYPERDGFISACQKGYKLAPINYAVSVLSVVLQVISLLIFKSTFIGFAFYTGVPIVTQLVSCFLIGIFSARWYPIIKEKPQGKLSKTEKKDLYKNVYGLALSKVCTIINNSIDSIIISSIIGVAVLGNYSLYYSLIAMVSGFVGNIFSAITPSIGNLNSSCTVEHKKRIFKVVYLSSILIYGFCAISYVAIVQPFMVIWAGEDKILGVFVPVVVALNFLTSGMASSVSQFRNACGLYYKGRHRPIMATILNIGFSILIGYLFNKYFGEVWGIFGIVLATILSRMAITWWYDAFIVFKYVFNEKPVKYLLKYLLDLFIIVLIGTGIYFICQLFTRLNIWINLVCCVAVCIVVVPAVFFAIYGRDHSFDYLKKSIVSVFSKIFHRRKRTKKS